MTVEEKMDLLKETFEIESDDFSPKMELSELDAWDSMTKLSLIVMMSDECGKELTSNEIKNFVTVQDILDYME